MGWLLLDDERMPGRWLLFRERRFMCYLRALRLA
jgi:hypothetical protein